MTHSSKKWLKTGTSDYTLRDNDQVIGHLDIALNNSEKKVIATIGEKKYFVKKTGFWKMNLEITGPENQLIARLFSENWMANSYILEYGDKSYT